MAKNKSKRLDACMLVLRARRHGLEGWAGKGVRRHGLEGWAGKGAQCDGYDSSFYPGTLGSEEKREGKGCGSKDTQSREGKREKERGGKEKEGDIYI